jgi:hypothetical protein
MNCCPPPEGWLQEAVRVASFGGGGLAFGQACFVLAVILTSCVRAFCAALV